MNKKTVMSLLVVSALYASTMLCMMRDEDCMVCMGGPRTEFPTPEEQELIERTLSVCKTLNVLETRAKLSTLGPQSLIFRKVFREKAQREWETTFNLGLGVASEFEFQQQENNPALTRLVRPIAGGHRPRVATIMNGDKKESD